jgi:hypothetical protein
MKLVTKLTVTLVIFALITMQPVVAQDILELREREDELASEDEPADVQNSQALTAEFIQYTQSPSSKVARFEMVLTANETSNRVRVTWEVRGSSIAVKEEQLVMNFRVEKGLTYTIPIDIKPVNQGVTEVYGVARMFGVDSSSVTTVRKNFATNENLEILPLTDEYKQSKLLGTVWNIAKIIILLVVVILGGFFGLKGFARWYNTNDRETFERAGKK